MMMWTIMPMDVIFPQSYSPDYNEIEYAGTKMMIEKMTASEYRVVRILSTDPEDYLRRDIKPGTVLVSNSSFEAAIQHQG